MQFLQIWERSETFIHTLLPDFWALLEDMFVLFGRSRIWLQIENHTSLKRKLIKISFCPHFTV